MHSMTRPGLFTLCICLKDFESGLVGLDSKSRVWGATICPCKSKSMLRTMRLFNFLHYYFAYSCAERRDRCTLLLSGILISARFIYIGAYPRYIYTLGNLLYYMTVQLIQTALSLVLKKRRKCNKRKTLLALFLYKIIIPA